MRYRDNLILRFQTSISQVDELLAIHHYLQSSSVTPMTDNILRATLAMLVSAIDTTVHELVLNAIIFELKERKSIFKIEKIKVSVTISQENDFESQLRLIEADLRRQYAKESFQSPRQIETALATIGITKIWTKLSLMTGRKAEDLKTTLNLLVQRRNQIVHEGDLDQLHNPREIERQDIDDALQFTKDLVNGMIQEYTNLITMT